MTCDDFMSHLVVEHVCYRVHKFFHFLLWQLHLVFHPWIDSNLSNQPPFLYVYHIDDDVLLGLERLLSLPLLLIIGGHSVAAWDVVCLQRQQLLRVFDLLPGQLLFLDHCEEVFAADWQGNNVVSVVNLPSIWLQGVKSLSLETEEVKSAMQYYFVSMEPSVDQMVIFPSRRLTNISFS